MSNQLQQYWRKIAHWYMALSHRERVIVWLTSAALVVAGIYQLGQGVDDYIRSNNRSLAMRRTQLEDVQKVLKRYVTLKARQDTMQKTFAQSELTFEQVTSRLDKIVRESIGSDNYDLKKTRTPTAFGFAYEKQDFSVNIKSITIEQLVKLLYQLEHGDSPLFLSKLDIQRSTMTNDYGAILEIYSIAKARKPAGSASS